MSTRGHRQIDHTADIALELWAPTQADLLRVGAEAIVAVMTEDAPTPQANARVTVSFDALDPGDRLVRWLNEVIVLAVVDYVLYVDADIELVGDGLRATVRGLGDCHLKQELKAATYHDLKIEETADGWRARVVIDV